MLVGAHARKPSVVFVCSEGGWRLTDDSCGRNMVLPLVHLDVIELVTSHFVWEGGDSLEKHET